MTSGDKARLSPLGYFLAFALALILAMIGAAVLSPALQALLAPLQIIPLHRIFSRLTQIGLLLLTIWFLIRQGLMRRDVLGYATPWPIFMRRLLWGLGAGLALMVVTLVPLFALDVRVWSNRLPGEVGGIVLMGAKALLQGLLVALIEENFFRGAMQGAMARAGSVRAALFVVPLLYSAVHFFGEAVRVPYEAVTATSGFTILLGFFAAFAHPLRIADAFLALYCVGLLLALVRCRWGDIAGCIGLHAGFVAVISMFRRVSAPGPDSSWSFLVGQFDGLVGLWIALLTLVACAVVWRMRAGTEPVRTA
jgi:membrane protease YdiL (CAAX protease family)